MTAPLQSTGGVVRALLWMALGAIAFATSWFLVRVASSELHPFVIAAWRNLFGLLWLLPMLTSAPRLLTRRHLTTHIRRAAAAAVAISALYYAIAFAPFADVLAIGFTAPLFATLGMALLAGHRIGLARGCALAGGLTGAAFILFDTPFSPGMAAAVVAAIASSLAILTIRKSADHDDPRATALWGFLLTTPASILLALPVMSWPSSSLWGILAGIGACAAAGQLALVRAFTTASVAALMPADLIRILLILLAGTYMFGETYVPATLVAGGLVFGASILVVWREQQLARAARLSASDS